MNLKLSAQDMVPTAAKLGSAATVSSFKVTALRQLGTQVLAQHARYEAALAVVCKTGATYQKRAALQVLLRHSSSLSYFVSNEGHSEPALMPCRLHTRASHQLQPSTVQPEVCYHFWVQPCGYGLAWIWLLRRLVLTTQES